MSDIFGDTLKPDGLTIDVTRVMTLEEWGAAVELVSGLSIASNWWIGDLLAYGELTYGEKYAQGIPEGMSLSVLRSAQWVAERVPPANRHPALSWSHHRAVAALEPLEQAPLLDEAEAEGWSVAELRRRVKGTEAPEKREKAAGTMGAVDIDEGAVAVIFDAGVPTWWMPGAKVTVGPA